MLRAFQIFIGIFVLMCFLSYLWNPSGFTPSQVDRALQSPSWSHWLGTDSLGRDYLSRVVVGTRISVAVAFGSTLISFFIGVFFAALMMKMRGLSQILSHRFVDLLMGLPSFMVIAVLMVATESDSIVALIFWMGALHWAGLARLTQNEWIKIQAEPYIESTRALGAHFSHIFLRHLVPASRSIWGVWFCYHLPAEIMFESSMSFLGFGVQPPQVSLGLLIQEAWQYLGFQPLFILVPALLIFILVMSLYYIRGFRNSRPSMM